MNRKMLVSFALVSTFSAGALGAQKKVAFLKEFPTDAAMTEAITAYPAEENFNQVMSAWKNMKRSPASAELSESNLSPSFKSMRDAVLAANTADQLEAELAKLESGFDKLDSDAQYFAAQMLVLKDMRGIIWRLRPIVETGAKGSRATHSMTVSVLRSTRAGIEAYIPTEQWKAGFEFVTVPSKSMTLADQFHTIHDFQNWLATTEGPRLAKAAKAVGKVIAQAKAETVYAWDNKISYGKGAFADGLKRYEGHGQAEMRATYAYMMFSLHNLYVACAYNMDDLARVEASLGKLYGVDGFLPGRVLGVTNEDRVGVLKSYKNSGFFALDRANGATYMAKAFEYLKASVRSSDEVYTLTQGKAGNDNFAINPILLQQDHSPTLGAGLEKVKAMVAGPATLRSRLTGTTVELNLPAFYSNPPESLLDLLPNGFDKGGKQQSFKNAKGETIEVRDYAQGMPVSWDSGTWSKYVPSAAGKDGKYMLEANQILRTSVGSNYFWTPMSYYFN